MPVVVNTSVTCSRLRPSAGVFSSWNNATPSPSSSQPGHRWFSHHTACGQQLRRSTESDKRCTHRSSKRGTQVDVPLLQQLQEGVANVRRGRMCVAGNGRVRVPLRHTLRRREHALVPVQPHGQQAAVNAFQCSAHSPPQRLCKIPRHSQPQVKRAVQTVVATWTQHEDIDSELTRTGKRHKTNRGQQGHRNHAVLTSVPFASSCAVGEGSTSMHDSASRVKSLSATQLSKVAAASSFRFFSSAFTI